MFLAYFASMMFGYGAAHELSGLWIWLAAIGTCQGVFALFTMYLPPLFPVLLRTTGAGFCYNIGRIAAAAASVIFGLLAPVGEFRTALLVSSLLAFVAATAAWWLPADPQDA